MKRTFLIGLVAGLMCINGSAYANTSRLCAGFQYTVYDTATGNCQLYMMEGYWQPESGKCKCWPKNFSYTESVGPVDSAKQCQVLGKDHYDYWYEGYRPCPSPPSPPIFIGPF